MLLCQLPISNLQFPKRSQSIGSELLGSCPPPLVGSVAADELWRGLAVARLDPVRAEAGELEIGS